MLSLDHIPARILSAADYEAEARHYMSASAYAYVAGGSGDERTLAANQAAFSRVQVWPRLLRKLDHGHTRLSLLGHMLSHPVLLAPVAYQKLAHPQGELETARAAAALDTCMLVSTLASCSLEEIAGVAGGEKWFQLYFQPTRQATADLLRRAEAAGYSAIVATLDSVIQTPGRRARLAGFALPEGVRAVNLDPYGPPPAVHLNPEDSVVFQGVMSEAPNWEDLAWLLENTRLPVIVKGVLHPEDARQLQAAGVAGLIVSNHGGRALDRVPASLDVLPLIRQALGADYPLLLDGGIRSGSDIFCALAQGANAVLIGRLQVYALAVAGALGVAHLLRSLQEELAYCMALAGCATLDEISPEMIFSPGKQHVDSH